MLSVANLVESQNGVSEFRLRRKERERETAQVFWREQRETVVGERENLLSLLPVTVVVWRGLSELLASTEVSAKHGSPSYGV